MGPALAPFGVVLSRPAPNQPAQAASPNLEQVEQFKSVQKRFNTGQFYLGNAVKQQDNYDRNWDLNVVANDFQVIELSNPRDFLRSLQENPQDEGLSVSYSLPARVSLASRPDQQLVRITETALACQFYYLATPVLSPFVYREAELTNTGADVLLAGQISAYLDGHFVGRGEIASVSRGQTFVVGFGADTQLRAKRELVDRSENVQGGNREITFKYRLVIENYKDEKATVRVMDRVPNADRVTDIRVTLAESKDKLSEEALYLRNERPKGILRWDVEVGARSAGDKARLIEYSYKLEFDRNMAVTTPSAGVRAKEEFEQMQKARLLH
jgi:uncharacterized protein (TIGR02231 family)